MSGVVYQSKSFQSQQSSSSSSNTSQQQSSGTSTAKKSATPSSSSSKKGSQYFENAKKGEVEELREILKKHMFDRDEKKKRDIVKKVIAYMTLGIDVSKLFDQMVIVSQTGDLIQKKMIYLYLTNYAEQNPETALMAINTFIKDCGDKDPNVKGLALRSLCSLRFAGSVEYLLPAITKALQDFDSYVRKIAIMGCIKVFYMKPEVIKNKEIIDTLYKMIKDPDPMVMQNAICALNEILADEGGIKTFRQMIIHLLNHLKNFSNWGQTIVLQLVAKYQPKNEEEMFDIMNMLDERLKQSCISVVLATIKVFMNFTQNYPKIYNSVFKRVKTPLITLMSSTETTGSFEITFPVLSHINLIASKGGAEFFVDDFKQFYCKADEPTYIKFMKLNIISSLANENNIGDIMNELGEYVTDVDTELAKESIQTLGKIACRLQDMATPIIKQLSNFINMKREYITNNTLIAFQYILKKYPQVFKEIFECIPECVEYVTEPESKVYFIMNSNRCELICFFLISVPYFGSWENLATKLKGLLMFFRTLQQMNPLNRLKSNKPTPDEMRTTLGQAFSSFLNKDEDTDLRDRAAFFYRSMQDDIEGFTQTMLNNHSRAIAKFSEEKEEQDEQANFAFNTLSVIFKKSQDKFIKPFSYFSMQRNKEQAQEEKEVEIQVDETTEQIAPESVQSVNPNSPADLIDLSDDTPKQQIQVQASAISQPLNLLDLDDHFGAPKLAEFQTQDLVLNFSVDPDDYEPAWNSLNEGSTITRLVNPGIPITENFIEEFFKKYRIYSAAQGEEDQTLKFYLYSKHAATGEIVYMDFDLNLGSKILSLGTRCANEELAAFFSKFVQGILKTSGILQ